MVATASEHRLADVAAKKSVGLRYIMYFFCV